MKTLALIILIGLIGLFFWHIGCLVMEFMKPSEGVEGEDIQ